MVLLLCTGLCFTAGPLLAKSKRSTPSSLLDREYVGALALANRFLAAWQIQDHEAGIVLLTDAAKRQISEDQLQIFFAPGSEIQQGYEINRGRKLAVGRYTFPVALFEIGPDHKWVHPHFSQIIVVNSGKDDWAVDKLP
jgi:hypothetical protein